MKGGSLHTADLSWCSPAVIHIEFFQQVLIECLVYVLHCLTLQDTVEGTKEHKTLTFGIECLIGDVRCTYDMRK